MNSRFDRELIVSKNSLISALGKYLIFQSPYTYPKNFTNCLDEFESLLHRQYQLSFDEVGFVTIKVNELITFIERAFLNCPSIQELNNPKSGHTESVIFYSRFDEPKNPDDDFIDLYALARNVVIDHIMEQESEEYLKKKGDLKQMITRVTKSFKFEMAHILDASYSKECQNIHGHSYKLEIEFDGHINDDGMVIDFKQINDFAKSIIDRLDHSLVISEATANQEAFIAFKKAGYKLFVFRNNPTAENMCQWIFEEIRDQTHLVSRVRLWETATSYAEVCYQ